MAWNLNLLQTKTSKIFPKDITFKLKNYNHGNCHICYTYINTFTARALFGNPPRNADDEFIRHAKATWKMSKNAYDVYTRHKLSVQKCRWRDNLSFRWLWFFLYFYFTSYLQPGFSVFCNFTNIFALPIEVILAVTFWRCEKYCMRSKKIKHGFSRIISRLCQHLKL